MKTLIMILMVLGFHKVSAQEITGTWAGKLDNNGSKLTIVFHITATGNGYTATMDSPDQGANGLATDSTSYRDHQLSIDASKYGIHYRGRLDADGNVIHGLFKQGTGSQELDLGKATSDKKTSAMEARPQDPAVYPYYREDIVFQNRAAGVQLSGTLTLPADRQAKAIVILITGSGPQNRDEEIPQFNHRPFLVWSDWLTRQGIAVLRYDDRGIAKSTGDFMHSTSMDFAGDAEAAVAYVKSRRDLSGLSIGLMGHSEGGMIAPIVASREPSIKFVVLLAGPGVAIKELMLAQMAKQQELDQTPHNVALLNEQSAVQAFDYLIKNKSASADDIKPGLELLLRKTLDQYPADAFQKTSLTETLNQTLNTYLIPWFRYFIAFDPKLYLTRLHCAVLALNGTLDSQVMCDQNLNAIKEDLEIAGNKAFTIDSLKGLNHLMQKAQTGSVKEYGQISETVDPVALNTVSTWINKL